MGRAKVRVYCENDATVQDINSGKTRDASMLHCLRESCYFTAKHSVSFEQGTSREFRTGYQTCCQDGPSVPRPKTSLLNLQPTVTWYRCMYMNN